MLELFVSSTHTKLKYTDLSKDERNEIISLIEEKFTATDSSVTHSPACRNGWISDKKCFYNAEYSLLPTGFLAYLKIYLKKANIEFKITDTRKFPYIDLDFINQDKIIFGKYEARDYQIEAVKAAIKYKTAILNLATSSGKTLIAAMLIKAFPKAKILMGFQSIDLIQQTYNNFVDDYKIPASEIGVIQGENFDDTKRVTLLSALSYEKAFHIFRNINVVIFDEVHSLGVTDTGEKILYSCQNAPIHIGLSATPDKLENPYQQMRIYSNIGPIVYDRKVDEQIEVGAVSPVEVKLIKIKQKQIKIIGHWADSYDYEDVTSERRKLKLIEDGFTIYNEDNKEKAKKFKEYGDESNHYVYNDYRNEIIAKLAVKLKRVLIIFTRIQHGKLLLESIERAFPGRAMLVSGEDDVQTRKKAMNYLETDENSIVIASNVFSVGISINAIENVILTSAGKSAIQTIQRVGRGLRLSAKTGKEKATIYDFYDETLSKIAFKQSEKRKRIYQSLNVPVKIIEL
jgi:superfamily II DNA or RNA helicase